MLIANKCMTNHRHSRGLAQSSYDLDPGGMILPQTQGAKTTLSRLSPGRIDLAGRRHLSPHACQTSAITKTRPWLTSNCNYALARLPSQSLGILCKEQTIMMQINPWMTLADVKTDRRV